MCLEESTQRFSKLDAVYHFLETDIFTYLEAKPGGAAELHVTARVTVGIQPIGGLPARS